MFFHQDEESNQKKKKPVDKYNQRIGDYVDGFTVHGLTKVFKGSRKEACVWMLFICLGMLFAGLVIGRLVAKYYRYETYTEVKSIVTDENLLPSITVCEIQELQMAYFNYCGTRMSDRSGSDKICNISNIPDSLVENNSSIVQGKWQNRLFRIETCRPWEKAPCNSHTYFKSHSYGACFTWNYAGHFHDNYGHVDFRFKYIGNASEESRRIIIVPHDPRVTEIDLTKMITIETEKNYEIKIGKTYIRRKPQPYSDCTSKPTSEEMDVFPGAYDRLTCIETYKQLTTFKKCGAIFDNFKSYLSDDFIKAHEKNLTIGEAKMCIVRNVYSTKTPEHVCPFACEELSLNVHSNMFASREGADVYAFGIQLENVDTYTVLEEQPLYSAEQMSAEIGGFLGLVVGASMLSFIEIFACGFLFLMKKANEGKN